MKKFFCILLALLMLCGCGKSVDDKIIEDDEPIATIDIDTSEDKSLYYLNMLKDFKPIDKNKDNTTDNEDFNTFLDKVFDDVVSENYLFLHNNVTDYKAMGISKPEVTWGTLNYELNQEEIDLLVDEYNELITFDPDTLSYTQQYNYDVFRYSLLESLTGEYFYKYGLIFSDANSLSEGIITSLMEFGFYDEESVDDYITLLKEVPDYINQAIEYSKKQSEDGLYHSDTMLDAEVTYIKSIIEDDGQSLIDSFKTNSPYLDRYDEVVNIIKYDVCDAFNSLYDYVLTLYGKGDDASLQLCNIDENYAEYTLLVNTSTNGNLADVFTELFNYYADTVNAFFKAYQEDEDLYNNYLLYVSSKDSEPLNLSSKEMLEYLNNNIGERYKKIDTSYEISELTTLGSSTVGYYVSAPLDDLNRNVIRLNASKSDIEGISAYETLAHEGFPGHLYQHCYYQQTNPHKFRSTQFFIGYTEGYADLASLDAFEMLNFPDENMITCAKIDSMTFNSHIILSIIDIAVNYMGYDLDALKDLMEEMNLSSDYAEDYYKTVISMPGVFCRYGVGFIKHYNIRENAKDELGDNFDYIAYSDAILKNGELPFVLLEGAVQEYIDENK